MVGRVGMVVAVVLASVPAGCAHAAPPGVTAAAATAAGAPALDPEVLALARRAAGCAERAGLVPRPGLLAVIDYRRPSNTRRFWVLDAATGAVRYQALVAHGRGSGELTATRFSNTSGSKQSSLGLFVTGEVYEGVHGRSLRLHGLEPGVNDQAYDRAIVMHGADYVSDVFAAANGRLGRSHGCPVLGLDVAQPVIDTIRDGTVLFAYYPDTAWLRGSRFLGGCAAAPAPAVTTNGAGPR